MDKRWLSWAEASGVLRRRLKASPGWAEASLIRGIDIGEVRLRVHLAAGLAGPGGTFHVRRIGVNRLKVTVLMTSPVVPGAAEFDEIVEDSAVEVSEGHLSDWLDRYAPADGDSRGSGGLKVRAARKAMNEAFPEGPPDQTVMGNPAFVQRVRAKLSDAWNAPVSKGGMHDSAILRAGGRK